MSQPNQVYYQQIVRPPSNGLAIASLVLGVVGILPGLLVVIPFVGLIMAMFALLPAVLAVVFGHIGLNQAKRLNGLGRGMAQAGLILGYVTLGLMVLTTLFWIFAAIVGAATSGS
jgi:uncharacterized membrane protein